MNAWPSGPNRVVALDLTLRGGDRVAEIPTEIVDAYLATLAAAAVFIWWNSRANRYAGRARVLSRITSDEGLTIDPAVSPDGRFIAYASDRGGRTANIWAYDLKTKQHRQVTHFDEYDVKWPSIGGDSIVFENGGQLSVLDLPSDKPVAVKVLVPDDRPATRPELRNVSRFINGYDLSPSAKRAVFEARGDLFTVPAEKGDVRNLTHSPGSRERDPAWSPDGKWIAYLSDASGEYQIHVIGSDGKTPDRQVTKVFKALSDGGQITMPMQQAFWAKAWGMLVDKFGTPWIVNGELVEMK